MNTNSSDNSFVNPSNSNLNAAITEIGAKRSFAVMTAELGAAGTLATVATHATAMGIGQVIVATIGTSALAVSLPAVVAVGAAGCIGLSLGKKIVNAINKA